MPFLDNSKALFFLSQDTYSTASTITLVSNSGSGSSQPQNQAGTPAGSVGTPGEVNRTLPIITKEPPPIAPPTAFAGGGTSGGGSTCGTPTNKRQKSWDLMDQNALVQVCLLFLSF